MARITFKAKAEDFWLAGEEAPRYQTVKIPALKRSHCDMAAFRVHKKYGSYANSDIFPQILKNIRTEIFGHCLYLRLDQPPPGVVIDTSGFLVTVQFDV